MRSSSPFLALRLESIHNLLLRGRQLPLMMDGNGSPVLIVFAGLCHRMRQLGLCHLPQFFISVTHSSLQVCPGSSKHPCVFLMPFGSYMYVTAEGECLCSICISTLDEHEEYRGCVSARNALEKNPKAE